MSLYRQVRAREGGFGAIRAQSESFGRGSEEKTTLELARISLDPSAAVGGSRRQPAHMASSHAHSQAVEDEAGHSSA